MAIGADGVLGRRGERMADAIALRDCILDCMRVAGRPAPDDPHARVLLRAGAVARLVEKAGVRTLTVRGKTRLLALRWSTGAEIRIDLFVRGPWEREFDPA